ncbi:hypothetical protein FK178_03830 [Antarcticibacterium arcticum]|uniref:SdiA-regulated family protein n=1 Tax=Antarcticibacterium arcticum TaxID=2585771 RepID=A0A5B8YJV2_9FLAO|nr:SdiA-regulated domain-containing protein [Antarcticibacterium arcticum]QED36893.1 hypothetical protein FK178_03830 [Antarcticibacterium arcticum]
MQKAAFLIVLGVLTVVGFLIFGVDSKSNTARALESDSVKIEKKWELPEILREVSGIAYMGNNKIACVQDEDGIIFIFNLATTSIEKEIEFAGPGDYEGISLVGGTAYVLRSDGTIFEVTNFNEAAPQTSKYETPLKGKLNFEGLGYDENNNRLLIALKEKSGDDFKPVYAFELENKIWVTEPVIKIKFNDPVFGILNQKISRKMLRPSEITLHPSTGKIFVLEGLGPKLLILDQSGKPEEIHILNSKQFPQAEGLTFGDSGEIYISNEGSGQAANILEISLNK